MRRAAASVRWNSDCKLFGARRDSHRELRRKVGEGTQLGADETIDYTRDDWPKEVKRLRMVEALMWCSSTTGAKTMAGSIFVSEKRRAAGDLWATSALHASTDLRHVFYRHLTILGSMMGRRPTCWRR
jgi:NADPH:quinone reductase-like Zn-dependent oxidoreductase